MKFMYYSIIKFLYGSQQGITLVKSMICIKTACNSMYRLFECYLYNSIKPSISSLVEKHQLLEIQFSRHPLLMFAFGCWWMRGRWSRWWVGLFGKALFPVPVHGEDGHSTLSCCTVKMAPALFLGARWRWPQHSSLVHGEDGHSTLSCCTVKMAPALFPGARWRCPQHSFLVHGEDAPSTLPFCTVKMPPALFPGARWRWPQHSFLVHGVDGPSTLSWCTVKMTPSALFPGARWRWPQHSSLMHNEDGHSTLPWCTMKIAIALFPNAQWRWP